MDKSRFFKILRNIQIYGYERAFPEMLVEDAEGIVCVKSSENQVDIQLDLSKFQINISKNKSGEDYRFLVFNRHGGSLQRYAVLSAYLQGALLLKDAKGNYHPDESFTNYQKNDLKLLFGSFAFIDKENNKLHYLLGSSPSSLKQSFQFKTYYNIENQRGQGELQQIPSNIMKFLFEVNQTSRDNVEYIRNLDFYKILNNVQYQRKRNTIIEKKRNIVYVSSGEVDHCVLQWILLNRNNLQCMEPENELFSFDFNTIYEEYNDIFSNNNIEIPYLNKNEKKLNDWLKDWGLAALASLSSSHAGEGIKLSERLLAALEWFYFYLLKIRTVSGGDYYDYTHYLDYIPEDEIGQREPYLVINEENSEYIEDYIRSFEGLYPHMAVNERKKFGRVAAEDMEYINGFEDLVKSYLRILLCIEESPDKFMKRCRFNPEIHFLFRNCISEFYWHGTGDRMDIPKREIYQFKEKTCRGLIYIPILNGPEIEDDSLAGTGDGSEQVGYFIGHIKDSDIKGRNFFTHYRRQDGELDEWIGNYFEEEFYELNHVINTLGRIEREEVYLKGILKKHLKAENEKMELRQMTSFSLTTHSFKTEIKTTIIPQFKLMKAEVNTPLFEKRLAELEEMCNSLYNLAGVTSLIDKVKVGTDFRESGIKDNLLSEEECGINIDESIAAFNKLHRHMPPVVRVQGKVLQPLSIKIHNTYFTKDILHLFCHTLFENLLTYGKRIDRSIPVEINCQDRSWHFTNTIKDENRLPDKAKLRGNLYLFQSLLRGSGCGDLEIQAQKDQFTVHLTQELK